MQRRTCGKASLELPVIGVGVWAFGGGDYWGPQSQDDAEAVVARAIEIGCNYFDTAEAYNDGASEESLGRALKGRRDKAVIGTKVSPENTRPDVLRAHCEASLHRLGTDYIDLYMVHWPIHPQSLGRPAEDKEALARLPSTAEAVGELVRLRDEGKIRHIGVSNFGAGQLSEALEAGAVIAADQVMYSLLSRAIEYELVEFCRRRGVGILAYMPLMQGSLTGKYESAKDVPPLRARTRHFSGKRPDSRHGEAGAEEETFAAVSKIRGIAEEEGVSMAALALAWCAVDPAVTCVLVGARNVRQLQENARAGELMLSPQTIERLNAATGPLKTKLGPRFDYWTSDKMTRTW